MPARAGKPRGPEGHVWSVRGRSPSGSFPAAESPAGPLGHGHTSAQSRFAVMPSLHPAPPHRLSAALALICPSIQDGPPLTVLRKNVPERTNGDRRAASVSDANQPQSRPARRSADHVVIHPARLRVASLTQEGRHTKALPSTESKRLDDRAPRCRSGRPASVSPGAPETTASPWLSSSLSA